MLRMVTQAEYENKIKSYQHQISEYQQKIDFLSAERAGNLRHAERTKDYEWGRKQAEVRTDQINSYISRINTAKNDLWEYQKQIAQEEQEQQVLAIRKAISDQVQLEQEKIMQSKQNQQIMIKEPSAIIQEPIMEKSFALGSLSLVALAIGGFLVLR
tara:strand:+ start:489 stop:959 length:471 start_codon:yes stop_codon:yes gene_type:complete